MTVGIGLQQAHGAACVGAQQVEQIGRSFRDTFEDFFRVRERAGNILQRGGDLGRGITQPVRKPPPGVFGCK